MNNQLRIFWSVSLRNGLKLSPPPWYLFLPQLLDVLVASPLRCRACIWSRVWITAKASHFNCRVTIKGFQCSILIIHARWPWVSCSWALPRRERHWIGSSGFHIYWFWVKGNWKVSRPARTWMGDILYWTELKIYEKVKTAAEEIKKWKFMIASIR